MWFHLYQIPRIGKSLETRKQISGCQGPGRGENGEWLFNSKGNEIVLELHSGDDCTHYECTKCNWTVQFKMVNFTSNFFYIYICDTYFKEYVYACVWVSVGLDLIVCWLSSAFLFYLSPLIRNLNYIFYLPPQLRSNLM